MTSSHTILAIKKKQWNWGKIVQCRALSKRFGSQFQKLSQLDGGHKGTSPVGTQDNSQALEVTTKQMWCIDNRAHNCINVSP